MTQSTRFHPLTAAAPPGWDAPARPPSVRARLLNWYLRRTLKRSSETPHDPRRVRLRMEQRPIPHDKAGIDVEPARGEVRGEWQRPSGGEGRHMLLYLHGGGYVFGSPRTHRSLTVPLARASEFDLFSLDYRLAPEHPCPAALDDALRAYRWLVASGGEVTRLAVAGDSAGAGLAIALVQALRDAGDPLPACVVCYCPFVDLSLCSASVHVNAKSEAMFAVDAYRRAASAYAGDLPFTDSRVSPLNGDMTDLPPLQIFASTTEVLLDDAKHLASAAVRAGVETELILKRGLVHAWPVFPILPETKATLRATTTFLRKHVSP